MGRVEQMGEHLNKSATSKDILNRDANRILKLTNQSNFNPRAVIDWLLAWKLNILVLPWIIL